MTDKPMNGNSVGSVEFETEELPGLTEAEMVKIEQGAKEAVADLMKSAEAGPSGVTGMPTVGQAEQMFDAMVMQIVGTMIRGLMVSTNVPPDVLWRSIMRVEARLIAESLAGDLGPVLGARGAIKAALTDTLKTLPVKPAGPPQPGFPGLRRQ